MADAPTTQDSSAAPAADVPESVFDAARQEIAALLEADAPTTAPAQEADPSAADRSTDATLAPSEADEATGKDSRRARGEDAYERGLREGRETAERERVEAEQANATRAQAATAKAELDKLIAEAALPDDGTYETQDRRAQAREKLGGLVAQDHVARSVDQAAETRGRNAVLLELTQDIQKLRLEDVDAEGHTALYAAPSVTEFGRRAFDLGRKSQDAKIADLQGQLAAARGKLAGSGASPLASGVRLNGGGSHLKGMAGDFQQAAAELGYPLN